MRTLSHEPLLRGRDFRHHLAELLRVHPWRQFVLNLRRGYVARAERHLPRRVPRDLVGGRLAHNNEYGVVVWLYTRILEPCDGPREIFRLSDVAERKLRERVVRKRRARPP